MLDALGRPMAASVLVIGKADPTLATIRDFTDTPRDSQPDLGAYEFR